MQNIFKHNQLRFMHNIFKYNQLRYTCAPYPLTEVRLKTAPRRDILLWLVSKLQVQVEGSTIQKTKDSQALSLAFMPLGQNQAQFRIV